MAERLTQRVQGARLQIDLKNGGRIAGLWIDRYSVVAEQPASSLRWGSGVQAPWCGALKDGRFEFNSKEVTLDRNFQNHAVGGTVLGRRAEVIDETATRVEFGHTWPWKGHMLQRYTLERDSLTHTVELHSEEPMPMTLGWRSWFNRDLGLGGKGLRVHADAPKVFARSADGIVAEVTRAPFEQWPSQFYEGVSRSLIMHWSGELELWVTSDLPNIAVEDFGRRTVCIEPMSHRPEKLGMGSRMLIPGRPVKAEMVWRWRRLAPVPVPN